ncbi:MAG: hypothetical protein AAGD32_13630 [Planctomycetota bacterium]
MPDTTNALVEQIRQLAEDAPRCDFVHTICHAIGAFSPPTHSPAPGLLRSAVHVPTLELKLPLPSPIDVPKGWLPPMRVAYLWIVDESHAEVASRLETLVGRLPGDFCWEKFVEAEGVQHVAGNGAFLLRSAWDGLPQPQRAMVPLTGKGSPAFEVSVVSDAIFRLAAAVTPSQSGKETPAAAASPVGDVSSGKLRLSSSTELMIATRIRQLRSSNPAATMADVARHLQVDRGTVSKWQSMDHYPDVVESLRGI